PKSVTTPVAMDISETLSGISSLAAVFVMIAGIFGAMFSTFFFKMFHIDGPVGEVVGLGSASHAIGTSRASESGLKEGSISTIAMNLSDVFVSVLAPFSVEWIMYEKLLKHVWLGSFFGRFINVFFVTRARLTC